MSVLNYTCTKRFLFQGMLLIHMSQSKSSTMHVVFRVTACKVYIYPYHAGRNGEESIPMLMMNHTDKDEPPGPPGPGGLPPRNRPTPIDGKNSPRLVEITSNPGTPLKVTEIPGQYSCLEPVTLLSRLTLCPSAMLALTCQKWYCYHILLENKLIIRLNK